MRLVLARNSSSITVVFIFQRFSSRRIILTSLPSQSLAPSPVAFLFALRVRVDILILILILILIVVISSLSSTLSSQLSFLLSTLLGLLLSRGLLCPQVHSL